MIRAVVGGAVMAVAVAVGGSVFERFLSPDRPSDRAIINYLELAKSGRATSMDLADLGVLILEKGFPGDAIDYLQAALKLDKHNYEAAYRLGLVLQREGRDREATGYYKKTLKQRPGYAQARFMLAMAEERCGDREAAIHDYAKAYRYAPELANPLKNPLVYDSKLQTEAALRHYEEAARTSTLRVTEIDPASIRRMMEIKPPQGQGAGAPESTSQAQTQPPSPQPASAVPAAGATAAAPPARQPAGAPSQGVAPQGQPSGASPPFFGRQQPTGSQVRATPAPQPTPPPPPEEPAAAEPTPAPEPGPGAEMPPPTPEPAPDEMKPTPEPRSPVKNESELGLRACRPPGR